MLVIQEIYLLKRAEVKNNFKPITIRKALDVLLTAQMKITDSQLRKEIGVGFERVNNSNTL